MTDEEKALLASLNGQIARIEVLAVQFDQANRRRVQLPVMAAKQLRNLSEAAAECDTLIQTFAGQLDASKDVLHEVAAHLRTIHRRLDDVILPATIVD